MQELVAEADVPGNDFTEFVEMHVGRVDGADQFQGGSLVHADAPALDDIGPAEKKALEIVAASFFQGLELLMGLHLFRQYLEPVGFQALDQLQAVIEVHFQDIQLDDVGNFQQWDPVVGVDEVVQCDAVALLGKFPDMIDDLPIDNDVFQYFDDYPLPGQVQRRFGNNVLAGKVDEGLALADNVVQTEFQQGIGNDLVGGAGRALRFIEIEITAAEQDFVAVGFQVFVQDLLSTYQKVCHTGVPFVMMSFHSKIVAEFSHLLRKSGFYCMIMAIAGNQYQFTLPEKEMANEVTLAVSGMKCGGCENNVTTKLQGLDGVLSVTASHKDNTVTVQYDTARVDLDSIKQAIAEAGYTVE